MIVASLSATLVGMIAWGGTRWVQMVEDHIRASTSGYERIRALEVNTERMAAEVRGLRADQVEQALYQARREGDRERAKDLDARLKAIEKGGR